MVSAVSGLLFVLSGPSGVGKDALATRLLERVPRLRRVITAVTRAPRPSEVPGVDYHFLTREEFMREVERDGLLEWAEYVGSPRGTPRFGLVDVLRQGDDALLKIELDGARKVKVALPAAPATSGQASAATSARAISRIAEGCRARVASRQSRWSAIV